MAELSLRQIEDRLNAEFAGEGRRLIFWYDDRGDFSEDIGALDDAAYAAALVRHYGGKGYGPARVREELRRRGVDRELWDGALEELPEAEDTLDALIRKKCRGDLTDPREKKRLSDALLRRGFSWSDVRAAMARYTEMLEDDYG